MSDKQQGGHNPINDFQPGQVANRAKSTAGNVERETTQTLRASGNTTGDNKADLGGRLDDIKDQVQDSTRNVDRHDDTAVRSGGDRIDDATSTAQSKVDNTASSATRNAGAAIDSGVHEADNSGMGGMTWILALVVLMLIAAAVYYYFIR